MAISTRQLGRDGPLVPRIGFGTMSLSFSYGPPPPDEQRMAVLDRAHEIGARFWDTSDVYGDAEDLIGQWFARTGKRCDIFLATKFGGVLPKEGGVDGFTFRGDRAYVREACDGSLRRMGADHIDLLYPHRLDGSTPVEHIVAEMAQLKAEGKINHIGLCDVSAATLRRAHAVHPIAAVQVEYSPCATQIERGGGDGFREPLWATCRELGVAVVAYSPLARGLLSGAIELSSPSSSTTAPAPTGSSVEDDANVGLDDKGAPDTGSASFAEGDVRASYPRFAPSNLARNLCAVRTLHNEVAGPKGCSVGQLALAWLLAQGDVFPIPGTTKIERLEENFAAANVKLSSVEEARVRAVLDGAMFGENYSVEHTFAMCADTPLPE